MNSLHFLGRVALFILLGASPVVAAHTWQFRSPTPTGNRMESFAYGNGTFVGVGEHADVVTSPDGTDWTERFTGVAGELLRVIFDGTHFVAVGRGLDTAARGCVLRSADGVNWTSQSTPTVLLDLAYGNGVYVAIAEPATGATGNGFMTSTDGVTWTARTVAYDVKRVLFTAGRFVAPDLKGHVVTSTDGVSWIGATVAPDISEYRLGFAASPEMFLLSYPTGHTFASPDGTTWTEVTASMPTAWGGSTAAPMLSSDGTLGYAAGYFYASQSYDLPPLRSPDGRTWTKIVTNPRLNYETLAVGAGTLVAAEVGMINYEYANAKAYEIHTSTDGIEWTELGRAVVSPRYDARLVFGLGRFFLDHAISLDGFSWSLAPESFIPTHGVADHVFHVETNSARDLVTASSDGLTSAPVDLKLAHPLAVASGAGIYVWVGRNGEISTSVNGIDWTARTSGTTNALNAVTYAFNRFIAIGDRGTVLTSPDGMTWVKLADPAIATFDFKAIAASPDRVVLGAATDAVASATSALPDGTPIVVRGQPGFTSLAYFDGEFLATGASSIYPYFAPPMWLVRSSDGITWTAPATPLGGLHGLTIAIGNGTALVGGMAARSDEYYRRQYYALIQAVSTEAAVAPTISFPPPSISRPAGETAVFMVGLVATGPLTYQWRHAGVAIAGATDPVLRLTLVEAADAGDYTVTVTNSAGSATSVAATLTVTPAVPLAITRQPADAEVGNYTPVELSVEVSGSGPVIYQWRKNGAPIYGAMNSTYQLTAASPWAASADGDYDVVVTAPHSNITSRVARVVWGGITTEITALGNTRTPIGGSISITVHATGLHPPFTYQWGHQSGPDIPGAVYPTLALENITSADAGSYAVTVYDSAGHHEYANFQLIVVPDGSSQITIASQPAEQAVREGDAATLSVTVQGSAGYTYQWRHEGQPIRGATSSQLTIPAVNATTAGEYDVVIYAPDGSAVVSRSASVGVGESRLVNLSVLGFAGTGEETFIQGIVLRGGTADDQRRPLIRSVGPGLVPLNVEGALSDPSLKVLNASGTTVAINEDWSAPLRFGVTAAATAADMANCGAFPLVAGSADAALRLLVTGGGTFTIHASDAAGRSGRVLNEVYFDHPALRLMNLSARSRVSPGAGVLIAGFVIRGTAPINVLIRGVGPGLTAQGVIHPVANPKLTLLDHAGAVVDENDNWEQATNLAEMRSAMQSAGAFALAAGSADAAMFRRLAPGIYTVHVSSVDGSPGIALVELYDVK